VERLRVNALEEGQHLAPRGVVAIVTP
jgi:hypothetical protein